MNSFLQEIAAGSNNVVAGLKATAARYTNLEFRDGILAICAMVAAADGVIQAEEKQKVKKLILSNAALSHFPPADLGRQFETYVPKAMDEFGVLDLENIAAKLRKNADQADMAVKIGLIIANADGVFEDSEKVRMIAIIKKLGLSPATYGL
jgi:tellurite resistance protein TerB